MLNLKQALAERRENKILSLSKTWGDLLNSLFDVEVKLSEAVRAEPDKRIYICDVFFTEDETYIDHDVKRQIPNLFLPTCLVDEYACNQERWARIPDSFPKVNSEQDFPELANNEFSFGVEKIIISSKDFINLFKEKKDEFQNLVYPRIFEIFNKDFEVPSSILSLHVLGLEGPNQSNILLVRFRLTP